MAQAADVDLDHILWAMPEWIEYMLPNRTITTPDEALDYFAMSPFWNQQSNNHTLRVQTVVQQSMDPNFKYGHAEEKLALHRFNAGFEYVIGHSNPPNLYVVHRRDVGEDGKRDNVTGVWFILDEKIYPSPNLYDVMANRLKNASFLIGSTFSTLSAAHPPSNPRIHPSWRSLPPADPEKEKSQNLSKEAETPSDPSSRPDEPVVPNFALLNALQSTRQALARIDELSRAPAPALDPLEELKRLEEEMMGVRTGAAAGLVTNAGKSAKSISIAPSGLAADRARDFGSSKAGTPGARLMSAPTGRTPGLTAPSPLTSQQGL